MPIIKQDRPFDAEEVYEYFFSNPREALREFDRKRIEVSGVVLRTGLDGVFCQPCIELSEKAGGKCLVLCIFNDSKSYASLKAGDTVSIRGNYLVIRRDYGIVLSSAS